MTRNSTRQAPSPREGDELQAASQQAVTGPRPLLRIDGVVREYRKSGETKTKAKSNLKAFFVGHTGTFGDGALAPDDNVQGLLDLWVREDGAGRGRPQRLAGELPLPPPLGPGQGQDRAPSRRVPTARPDHLQGQEGRLRQDGRRDPAHRAPGLGCGTASPAQGRPDRQ